MSGKKNPEREGLDRLADALIDDILNASDEEILEEFREDGGDPEQHAAEMLALFERSVAIANKRRLAEDKAAAAVDRTTAANRHSAGPIDIDVLARETSFGFVVFGIEDVRTDEPMEINHDQ